MFQITGHPERVRSDNGRQFVSVETVAYLHAKGVVPEMSSPEFLSSMGTH